MDADDDAGAAASSGSEEDGTAVLRTLVDTDGIFALVLLLFVFMIWSREKVLKALNAWLDPPTEAPSASSYGSLDAVRPSWEEEPSCDEEGLPVARPTTDDDDLEDYWTEDRARSPPLAHRSLAVVWLAYLAFGTLAATTHHRVMRQAPRSCGILTALRLCVCGALALGHDAVADELSHVPGMKWWVSHAFPLVGTLVVALYGIYAAPSSGTLEAQGQGLYAVELPLVVPVVYALGSSLQSVVNDLMDFCVMLVIALTGMALLALQTAPAARIFIASVIVAVFYCQFQQTLKTNPDLRCTTLVWLVAPPAALLVAAYVYLYGPKHTGIGAVSSELVALDVLLAACLDLGRLGLLDATSAIAATMTDTSKEAIVALVASYLASSKHHFDPTFREALFVLLAAQLAWTLNQLLLKPAQSRYVVKEPAAVVHFADDHLDETGVPRHSATAATVVTF